MTRYALILLFATALGLSGCGRKAPLNVPPAPESQQNSFDAAPVEEPDARRSS